MEKRRSAPVAVVTGGGSGVGRAIGISLSTVGFHVVFCGRTPTTLQGSADIAEGGEVRVVDVTNLAAVDDMMQGVVARHGRIDVLVNSAGIFGSQREVDNTDIGEWERAMSVNVSGSFYCARTAFGVMKRQDPRGGRIINIGSVSAQVPRPEAVSYTASKHAVSGLTKAIALEGRAFDIACGQIDIGNASTEMTSSLGLNALQSDGVRRPEPMFDVAHVGAAAAFIAKLPTSVNVPFMTIMANRMPLLGRG